MDETIWTHRIVEIAPDSDWYSNGRSGLLGLRCRNVRPEDAQHLNRDNDDYCPPTFIIVRLDVEKLVKGLGGRTIMEDIRIRGVRLESLDTVPANVLVSSEDGWNDDE